MNDGDGGGGRGRGIGNGGLYLLPMNEVLSLIIFNIYIVLQILLLGFLCVQEPWLSKYVTELPKGKALGSTFYSA